jgi:hypothetical protein
MGTKIGAGLSVRGESQALIYDGSNIRIIDLKQKRTQNS